MAKHLLLGMTVRHITGSSKLITYLNRFGHCVSYATLLELETAICDAITESSTKLPVSLHTDGNKVINFCWDNFDLNEETPSGLGTTHSTHGIVIQEVEKRKIDICVSKTLSISKTKKRSASYKPGELQPCYLNVKSEPTIEINDVLISKTSNTSYIMREDFLWIFCRARLNVDGCTFPGWKGWLSETNSSLKFTKSIIDYMPPLEKSINDPATIQSIIKISQDATKELSQEYTFITFDLAVAKKAYTLVWQYPMQYKDVFIHLGAFHITLSYLKALGKLMRNSGFEDIVIEEGVCGSGSLEAVMSGSHYNRAFRIHFLLLEALERLCFTAFEQNMNTTNLIEDLKVKASKLKNNNTEANAESVFMSDALIELHAQYNVFKAGMKAGKYGQTAQFWSHYMENVWRLCRFLRAIKTNNFDLYLRSIRDLCPLLFSMDHFNYAKYLSAYFISLLNIDKTHPRAKNLIKDKGFSCQRSEIPASRTASDLTIEQTINKSAKTKGGIVGFSQSRPAYYRWCVTRHKRATFVDATNVLADIDEGKDDSHRELQPVNRRESENNVKKLMNSISQFINPFDTQGMELVCLSSGMIVSKDVSNDILVVNSQGEKDFQEFIDTRLITKKIPFHSPLKKKNLKTFSSITKKCTVKANNQKEITIKAQRNLFGQLIVMSESNNLDLKKIMAYPLSPVPWSLATADGLPLKTNKAILLQKLESLESSCAHDFSSPSSVHIIDGNALLQSLLSLPETFGELSAKVFASLPKSNIVHFVTDTYIKNSIKSPERNRRGSNAATAFLIRGPETKLPRNWKAFLSNEHNKTSLLNLLLAEWQRDGYAKKLQCRNVFFICQERCHRLTSEDGLLTECHLVEDLFSTQEEADTRIILHAIYASQEECCENIIIRSPDSDVFLLLLCFAERVKKPLFFDTGYGSKRRLIDINAIWRLKSAVFFWKAIIGLHAFTGCDSTSCFSRKGKLVPMRIMERDKDMTTIFASLGKHDSVPQTLQKQLEEFVCKLYGKPSCKEVNIVRYNYVRQRFKPGNGEPLSSSHGTDLSSLPPCKRVLEQHIKRANFQTRIWRQADIPKPCIGSPYESGWVELHPDQISIDWCAGDILPNALVDIISADQHVSQEIDEVSEIRTEDLEDWDSDENDTLRDADSDVSDEDYLKHC